MQPVPIQSACSKESHQSARGSRIARQLPIQSYATQASLEWGSFATRLDEEYRYGIVSPVHVIAKPALVEFWKRHPEAKGSLEAWYRIMRLEVFADFNALRKTFGSADYVDPFTVFNIGGNRYRLIAVVHYNRRKVYIRQVLTHAEYDGDKWKRRS